jgi:hypothetical protein
LQRWGSWDIFSFKTGQQAVNQFASQSIDAEAERIYPQYEILAPAFAVLTN